MGQAHQLICVVEPLRDRSRADDRCGNSATDTARLRRYYSYLCTVTNRPGAGFIMFVPPRAKPAQSVKEQESYMPSVKAFVCACTIAAMLSVSWLSTTVSAGEAGKDFTGPQIYMHYLVQRFLVLLKSNKLTEEEKENEIEKLLEKEVDFRSASVFVLGRHWKEMTPTQKKIYSRLFQEYEIANLRDTLIDYSADDLIIGDAERKSNTDTIVQMKVIREGEDPLGYSWRVRKVGRGYSIIDFYYQNKISYAVTRRGEFAGFLKNNPEGGIDKLIEELKIRLKKIQ